MVENQDRWLHVKQRRKKGLGRGRLAGRIEGVCYREGRGVSSSSGLGGPENARRWHGDVLPVNNQCMYADFSVTEAGRRRWWSNLLGCGPGWYRDLDRGHLVRCSDSCGGFFRVCEVPLGQDIG